MRLAEEIRLRRTALNIAQATAWTITLGYYHVHLGDLAGTESKNEEEQFQSKRIGAVKHLQNDGAGIPSGQVQKEA